MTARESQYEVNRLELPPHPPTFTPCKHEMVPTTKIGILKCRHCRYMIELVQERTAYDA